MTEPKATAEASGSDAKQKGAGQSVETLPAQLTEAELVRVETTTTSLVDKLVEEISPLVEAGIEAFTEDRERKDELRKLQLETTHQAMKRHSWLLGGLIVAVAGLALAALLLQQIDFAEIVLGSALAVAAGAGLTAMTGKKRD